MIEIYTTSWCGDCIRTKSFLEENQIKFNEIDIEKDEKAKNEVIKINDGNASVPTLVFVDGSVLVEPTNQELAEKLGI